MKRKIILGCILLVLLAAASTALAASVTLVRGNEASTGGDYALDQPRLDILEGEGYVLQAGQIYDTARMAAFAQMEFWRLGIASEGDASYDAVKGRLVHLSAQFRSDQGVVDTYYIFPAPGISKTVQSARFYLLSRTGAYSGAATMTLETLAYSGTVQHSVSVGGVDVQAAAPGAWTTMDLSADLNDLEIAPGEFLAFHFHLDGAPSGDLDARLLFEAQVAGDNAPPQLAPLGDQSVDELVTLVLTATATDDGLPANVLTFTLDAGSVGNITSDGVFDWTPTEADGPGVYTAAVRVSDGDLDDAETITITVAEVNVSPAARDDTFTVLEDSHDNLLTVLSNDTDADGNPLSLYAIGAPDHGGAALNAGTHITYTPATGYWGSETFTYTVSDGNGGLDTALVTVTVTPLPTYTLAVTIVGSGTVMLDPVGGVYEAGTQVTLTATPNAGWYFGGWMGDLGTADPVEHLTMDGDKIITATFSEIPPVPTYTLAVTIVGSGTVTLDPVGGVYEAGTQVTLTAAPNAGRYFGGWMGDLGTADPVEHLMMDGDKVVTATFSEIPPVPTYTLDVIIVGSGTVTLDPNLAYYDEGTIVTLTAAPEAGWQFAGWGGASTLYLSQALVLMNANKVVTATFTPVSVPCVALTDVALSLVTTGEFYPGDVITFSAALLPLGLTTPYSYTINGGATLSANVNPLGFTLAYTTPGTYTVELAVWNCTMTMPITDAVQVVIRTPQPSPFIIYLPVLTRNSGQ